MHKEMENLLTLQEISMRENGFIIRIMDMAYLFHLKEENMKVIGKMINFMGKVRKIGRMGPAMMESINMEKNTGMEK